MFLGKSRERGISHAASVIVEGEGIVGQNSRDIPHQTDQARAREADYMITAVPISVDFGAQIEASHYDDGYNTLLVARAGKRDPVQKLNNAPHDRKERQAFRVWLTPGRTGRSTGRGASASTQIAEAHQQAVLVRRD